MRKAILISTSFFPNLNGITFATLGHIRILQDLGFDVTLIISNKHAVPDLCHYALEDFKIKQFEIYGSGLPWNPIKGSIGLITQNIESINPDYVFVEGWYNWGIQVLLKLNHKCKKIVFSHGSAEIGIYGIPTLVRTVGYFLYDYYNSGKLFKKLDGVVLLSNYNDNNRFRDLKIAKNYGVKTFVLPNFNFEYIYRNSINYDIKTTKNFNIALIGEMCTNKNQAFIFKIIDNIGSNINFHFFYPLDNNYSKNIKKKKSILKNSNMLYFYQGFDRKHINMFMKNNIDLLLILSRTEAQPIVLIDALHQAIPFLSTKVGCVPVFKGGICCRLNEITEYLKKIVEDPIFYNEKKLETSIFNDQFNVKDKEFNFFLSNI